MPSHTNQVKDKKIKSVMALKKQATAGLNLMNVDLFWNTGLCHHHHLKNNIRSWRLSASPYGQLRCLGAVSTGSPAWACWGGGSSSKVIWSKAQVLPVSVHQHSPGSLCQMSIRTLICGWRSTPTHLWETHVSMSSCLTAAIVQLKGL